jgi:hypothetical protein
MVGVAILSYFTAVHVVSFLDYLFLALVHCGISTGFITTFIGLVHWIISTGYGHHFVGIHWHPFGCWDPSSPSSPCRYQLIGLISIICFAFAMPRGYYFVGTATLASLSSLSS